MKSKNIDRGAVACVINAEIGTVLAMMRRNARLAGTFVADDDSWEHSLVHSLKDLRRKLFTWHQPWEEINPLLYLQPFLDVVRSDDTSAPITGVALSAIYNILSFEAFDLTTAHIADAMHGLVEGITSCRFEVIDHASEEVVLMKILQVLLSLMKHEASKALSDRDLCLVVSTCFRVVQQATTKGELLQRTARHSMHEIMRVIFAHLPEIDPTSTDVSSNGSATSNDDDNNNNNNNVGFDAVIHLENVAHANGSSSKDSSEDVVEALSNLDGMNEMPPSHFKENVGEPERNPQKAIEPYGVVGIKEILRDLCSLLDSGVTKGQGVRAIDEDVPLFALQLIKTAVELGGRSFGLHPELLEVIQDDLFQSIMQLVLPNKNPLILSMVCNVVLHLYHHLRSHLKLQLEAFFSCVIIRLAQGKHGASYQQQEVAMEALVDFCRQPTFMSELYVNFDCDISCSNLFEDLVSLLSKSAFPVNVPLSAMHVLSLEGLVTVIQSMVDRVSHVQKVAPPCMDMPRSEFVPFWTMKCENYEDPNCWVDFVQRQKLIKQKLMIGADHFNRDQKKGFEFLQGIQLLPEKLNAKTVACFFRHTTGLDKELVGDFLGDPGEFSLQVLGEFVNTFDFKDMNLDVAMRVFLATFRLPGEAQKIHRILEAFSARYFEQSSHVLVDMDAAFVLAYSLILLNTDQHNTQVKKKMSEEDFIRNNRKINGGQDLPREYLSNLYHSIVKNEIKVSYTNGGSAEMSPSAWVGLVHKSKKMAPYIICDSRAFLDQDMFSIISGQAVAAVSVVFDHAEDEEVLELCEQGFFGLAKLSANYHLIEMLDDLVVSLCNFTTLLNPGGSTEDVIYSFAEDNRACMAAKTVFKIVNTYGDHIRSSWQSILECILQIHKIGLLPTCILNDNTDEMDTSSEMHGRPVVGNVNVVPTSNRKKSSGFIGRFSQLLYLEPDEPKTHPNEELLAAQQQAQKVIEACRIESIISESKFLQVESLSQLSTALVRASGRTQKIGGPFEDEDAAVLCLDLLIVVVLQNRDRILLLWHIVHEHISNIVQRTQVPCPLVEKAVFGLLRICQRLLPYKEELAEELLRSLQVILKLDARVADVLCERITQEVMQLVKANARHIQSPSGWRTVTSLLSITARHLEASEAGFETLSFVMLEGAHLSPANYVLFLDAAQAFVEATTGGLERSLHALDLMSESVKCLAKWSDTSLINETSSNAQELGEMWFKLAHSHRKLIVDPREDVRNHAVLSLQRILSAAENMHLSASTLGKIFDQIVFVVLDDLLEVATKHSPKEFRNMEGTLLFAMKLVSKTFLQFLDPLATLAVFPTMWSTVLKQMERYMKTKLRGKGTDKLQESIPELLKNMLLVMKNRGVLVQGTTADGYTLWDITWHHVESIAPLLRTELFPQESVNKPESAIEVSPAPEASIVL